MGVAGPTASRVVMQIHPEGGQSPCNIKVSTAAANERNCMRCGEALVFSAHISQTPTHRGRV